MWHIFGLNVHWLAKTWKNLKLSITVKTLKFSLHSIESESQALLFTVLNDYKVTVLSQSSLSDLSQKSDPTTENKNSLHGSHAYLNDEMKIKKHLVRLPQLIKMILDQTS